MDEEEAAEPGLTPAAAAVITEIINVHAKPPPPSPSTWPGFQVNLIASE